MVSYDPATPLAADHLAGLLAAVGPVGAGINLEYFFSFVDNEVYGAGPKLPHNVVGLLGVINGASSDLRTGLVQQMVEIHEPMRLLVVIEGTPVAALAAVRRTPAVQQLVDQRWVLLATFDPVENQVQFLETDGFEAHAVQAERLPGAPDSLAWYRGAAGHLRPARIGPDAAAEAA